MVAKRAVAVRHGGRGRGAYGAIAAVAGRGPGDRACPSPRAAASRAAAAATRSLSQAVESESLPASPPPNAAATTAALAEAAAPATNEPTLPSAAALAAQGIVLPTLRLELHAYGERSSDRFVFINGRKYVEGDRLADGPELLTIAPNGAVLRHLGQRFLLTPE
jgi:hypothetical protein